MCVLFQQTTIVKHQHLTENIRTVRPLVSVVWQALPASVHHEAQHSQLARFESF